MIEHLVWFKLRADAPEAAKERLLAELVALKDRIPGILDASGAPGTLVRARVEGTSDYDLVARAV